MTLLLHTHYFTHSLRKLEVLNEFQYMHCGINSLVLCAFLSRKVIKLSFSCRTTPPTRRSSMRTLANVRRFATAPGDFTGINNMIKEPKMIRLRRAKGPLRGQTAPRWGLLRG